jgi:putative membrane protein
MKKAIVYGTAVLALSGAPLLAQQSSGSGTGSRQGSATGTQSGTQGGSTATGGSTQGGSTQSGSSGATGGSSQGGATSGATQSGTRSQAGAAADASKSNPDRQFVMDAAQGGMAEVELGQLATQKASSDAVKQFGQRMVTDHGKANDELKTLAQSKSITLPTDIGAKHKATKDKLEKLSGAAFDRAYMQEMVSDHRKDVSDFRKESQSGKDPDVKAWAAKTLPTLEEHLKMAQAASTSAVGTSGTKSSDDAKPGSDNDKPTGGGSGLTPRPAGSEPTGKPAPGGGASGIGSPR